jgi:hypothetical protein
VHNTRDRNSKKSEKKMQDFVNAILFAGAALGLILGLSCIIMGFLSDKAGAEAIQERIEYGFFGVSGLVVTLLLAYAAA